MFKGTFKDILTNILSIMTVIGTIITVILDYSSTANLDNPVLYFIGLMIALGLWFIGKGSNGKAKKPTP